MFKRLLPLLLAAILLTACACTKAPVQVTQPQTSAAADVPAQTDTPVKTAEVTAPDAPAGDADGVSIGAFSLTDLSGNTVDESYFSDHKLVMVNFWATWCGPCVAEMPDVAKLAKDYADQGFAVLGVQIDEDADGARAVMADSGVEYPVIALTPDNVFYDLSLNMQYIPTTMFFDADGRQVGETAVGGNSYDGWKAVIDTYLGQVG